MTMPRKSLRTAAGLAVGALLLAAPAAPAFAAVDPGGSGGCPCPGTGPGGTGAPGATVSGAAHSAPGAVAGTQPGQTVKASTPGAGQGQP
ncbi:hypothetical protein GGC64_006300 [Mycobacterium sp. OAS707]|uniref:hypothetical protein n=1 Tax=Mycobacterium sp. OAS707 TaxID=2663822 RepID=UPI0017899D20|nr:hypothetical protein [Mycobacterium sp. OAS707]MBE1552213.1 hypothetical protein [Mycobacterium sp. OAS707]